MTADGPIHVNDRLSIPRSELEFRATRSGGPGGQHVNTSSTRIELVWNVADSPSLWEDERARLLEKLAHRIDGEGNIRVVSQGQRSQLQNREAATERLATLVARALVVPRQRKPTRPTRASKERRLEQKRRRGSIKRERRRREDD